MEAADNLTDAQVKFLKVWLILGVHKKVFHFHLGFLLTAWKKFSQSFKQ